MNLTHSKKHDIINEWINNNYRSRIYINLIINLIEEPVFNIFEL